MENIEIEKAKMDALRALSDTNLKLSAARASLQKLEENETEYAVSREKRVVKRIGEVLVESKELVEATIENYESVKTFHADLSEMAEKVVSAIDSIIKRDEVYGKRNEAWERDCNAQEEKMGELRRVIQLGNILLNSDKEGIERQKKLLLEKERKIADDRGALERAIKRLEEGKK